MLIRFAANLAAAAAIFLPFFAKANVFQMSGGDISLQFVNVGDAGNNADSTGYGAVDYNFQMGTYDVTMAQYAQFLNAVAAADPYGLYSAGMGDSFYSPNAGVSRTGSPGSYSYSVTGSAAGRDNMPMAYVSWGDAARFCNWLQNGQPTGAEGDGTTETGAYLLSGATSSAALMSVTAPLHTGSGAASISFPRRTNGTRPRTTSPAARTPDTGPIRHRATRRRTIPWRWRTANRTTRTTTKATTILIRRTT